MALSNIRREPRREITETVIGLAVAAAVVVPDYYAARWIAAQTNESWLWIMIILPVGLVLVLIAAAWALEGIHRLGEVVCDAFDERGISLRPKQRY